ncbi:hypothetical protein T265_02231 [Opisthorchis viverrini]|uniref:Uncharacterized protein n=1 Tax=Opisthorchis viverrini TaxID=6198 RepID=A0A075A7F8_OPIVI|nr:hypothetical protein T265_02231 [Opisthorchis viverrini]KER31595.1 hypothetical protein T265_02231 [Opisthorchis viverrini]
MVRARPLPLNFPCLGLGSIPALVLPSGGMATRHRKGATAERLRNPAVIGRTRGQREILGGG